jgi:DNA repair photolyase
MKRFGKQKPVRFDEKELKTDLGSGNFIFVGSSCDLFADDIPKQWIFNTTFHCNQYKNDYLFQTKNPDRIASGLFNLPIKSVVCTTIETNRWYPEVMMFSPHPNNRAMSMRSLQGRYDTYVTIEPILDFDLPVLVGLIEACNPRQVNIGADSGNNHLPEPSKDKILTLIEELKKFTTIDQKRNLARLLR